MPCIGCERRREIDMGITGNFWMRFIGKPDGKLMKHAPGNYIHGQKYKVPFGHSKFPYWELLEKPPELKVSEETESFEEAYYVPEDEPTVTESAPLEEITVTPSIGEDENYNFDPNAPATIEPYLKFNPATGKTSPVDPTEYLKSEPEPKVDESAALKMEIVRLKKALEEATKAPEPEEEPITEPEPEPEFIVEGVDDSVSLDETEESVEELDRNALLQTLTEKGIIIKKGTRTTTLKKMVDDLDQN